MTENREKDLKPIPTQRGNIGTVTVENIGGNSVTTANITTTGLYTNEITEGKPSVSQTNSAGRSFDPVRAKKSISKASHKSVNLLSVAFSPPSATTPSGQAAVLNYQLSTPYFLLNQPTRPAVYNRMVNPPTLPVPQIPLLLSRTTAMVKSTIGFDRNRNVRNQVERAIRDHKIFSCVGVYPAVRKALQKRGWVEKSPSLGVARSTNLENVMKELETRGFSEESDQTWMNRVLRDYPPDFIWVIRRDNIDWRALHKEQIVNRFPRAFFTTKVGIAVCLQSVQWFSETGLSDTFFPRCYRLCVDEERAAFVDDYRLTACMGLLKWVVETYEKEGEVGVMDPGSRVVSLAVDFAVRQVNNYVRMRRHEDIDWLMPPAFMGQHWDVFLSQYYNVVLLKGKLAPNDSNDTAKLKYEASKRALNRLAPYWPQLTIDGTKNIWICKPGARSRGKGIVIMNQLDKILDLLGQSNHREANWVVQKYIERPLIVYNTKFDIRQWFIVSDWNPLTVWFYKESYVRFCTKPFNLDDFHESIHLCNNAVQCRYQNSELRDHALPDENMWDCYTFQSYLKTLGKMDMWDSVIYPGMKQCIVGVMLASQESVDFRKNCFELYGADFMLSEDLHPWLIEINSCPCMAPSTSVTARMCAQCLEDTIKVVVDRREDKNADTGMFEMIYRQTQSTIPMPFNGLELTVQGKKLTKEVDWPKGARSSPKVGSIPGSLTFTDLVQRLRLKDAQGAATLTFDSSVGAIDTYTPRSLSYLSASNTNSSPKLSSEDKINQNSIISVRKLELQRGFKGPSENPLSRSTGHMTLDTTDQVHWKGKAIDSGSKTFISTGKAGTRPSHRAVEPRSRNSGNLTSNQLPTAGETLLSTLLQNSVTFHPTVADLVRLTQRANEAVKKADAPSSSSSSSKDRKGRSKDSSTPGSRGRSQNNKLSTTTPTASAYNTSGHAGSGKIRPNARTTIQPLSRSSPQSVQTLRQSTPEGSSRKINFESSSKGILKTG